MIRRRDGARQRQRLELVVAGDARQLLDHVVGHVDVRAPVRRADDVAVRRHPAAAEAEVGQRRAHLRRRQVDAQHLLDALPRDDDARVGALRRVGVDQALGRAAARELDQQLHRPPRRDGRQLRVQALLEPRSSLGAQVERLRSCGGC